MDEIESINALGVKVHQRAVMKDGKLEPMAAADQLPDPSIVDGPPDDVAGTFHVPPAAADATT